MFVLRSKTTAGVFFWGGETVIFYTNRFEMHAEILLSPLFSNWPRHLNLFEKARFLENLRKKNSEIWTTPVDQIRLTHARTTASVYSGNFTAKLLIAPLLNRSQAS